MNTITATINSALKWSEEQLAIFNEFEKGKSNVEVQARAGTGKTTTITYGITRAIENLIGYIVFNKKNQIEAKNKITDPRVDVRTWHSFCYKFVLSVWPKSRADWKIERERAQTVTGTNDNDVISPLTKLVSFLKNTTINPSIDDVMEVINSRDIQFPDSFPDSRGAQAALDVLALSRVQDKLNRISFDDMVWLPVVNKWIKPCFDLLVVDEAQDSNIVQLTAARMAINKGGAHIHGRGR